ncbi:hypothetical protein VHEMI03062 [[Torrubiella] hemipterigena]|uniref:1-alkyl-2-acetylglycerophosphocholine esterase n=1 Tax=[Torrubiella] hemipterigena TaxID=1531966 RepID=A0A0A1TA00_9HYPO|nr:hypothetical protein VHEMI03062 [[Torrubiella] hemipterigena]
MQLIPIYLCVATAAAILLPPTDGPYQVKWESQELIDYNRPDPFNTSRPRRLMISKFTPVPIANCLETCRVPYMPEFIANLEDEIIATFILPTVWPKGEIKQLEIEGCCKSKSSCSSGKFPKIIFDTGLNTTRLSYSWTAQHIASLGYEVIVPDHPYETDVIIYPDGEILYGNQIKKTIPSLEYGLTVRAKDTTFLLDKLRIKRTVFIGQSYGGAAAAESILADKRIAGGVNLDGMMFGPAVKQGINKPFLIFDSDGHNSTSDQSYADFLAAMGKNHPDVWVREVTVKGSGHGSGYDMPIIGDVTGHRDNQELVDIMYGGISGSRMKVMLQRYLGDFIEFALHSKGPGVLAGPNKDFPEVIYLH